MPGVKAQLNISVVYNGSDITAYLNDHSLEAVVNEIDTTTFASTGDEKTPGSTNWTINVGGLWAKALDDILGPDAVTTPDTLRDLVVTIGPDAADVEYAWNDNAFIGNYRIQASDPKGIITWTGTMAVSGAPIRT